MANTNKTKGRTFEAIVIGSGISGGWAAKELAENGIKTLVLERGRDVRHIEDYPTATKFPWEFEHRGKLPLEVERENPIVSKCYAFYEGSAHFFVKDKEHPYVQKKPFDWIRGYQVGGKSLLWARQTQRWSQYDFEGPARDGFAVDWPIRYEDLAPWYGHVEKFAGISGNKDGLSVLPDGEFLPPHAMNCVEEFFKKKVADNYNDRHVIMGRCAHITEAKPVHLQQGRTLCMHRTLCERGCPLGGYFSSNSSTLPWAAKTGNMTLRSNSVVHSIIYDEAKGRATGVRVVDSESNEMSEFYSDVIFVNASTLNTILILLNSVSNRFPNGLGNDNDLLGKYVAFHNYRPDITAEFEGFQEMTIRGRRPNNLYIPRFRNVHKQQTDFLRGYAAGFSASKGESFDTQGIGISLRENLLNPSPGPWTVRSHMMGETIPKETSYVALNPSKKDRFGMPLLDISVDYDQNDEKMIVDYFEQISEMFAHAGFTNIKQRDKKQAPGLDIHEMGGVRMGKDPRTSLLNKWNQLHECKNVFVTDGACMTSTSTQNPSLTYMALTARAVDHAIREKRKQNL